jgi:hypothetical protein
MLLPKSGERYRGGICLPDRRETDGRDDTLHTAQLSNVTIRADGATLGRNSNPAQPTATMPSIARRGGDLSFRWTYAYSVCMRLDPGVRPSRSCRAQHDGAGMPPVDVRA